VSPHPVRLRKRLDPQSLVAAERHPVTGRLVHQGRRNKAHNGPPATLMRHAFSGSAGVLAAGALVTLVAGGAAAAVKASRSSGRSEGNPAFVTGAPTSPTSPTPRHSAPAATLPAPCDLVSQSAAQTAVGVPLDPSENKPTSCLYAGKGPSPFRTLEITYDRQLRPDHVRSTLSAAHVTATPIAVLGAAAFSHPAFVQTVNGTTQFSPAEAVVPVGSLTVVIAAITLDEGAGARLVDPARDEAVTVAVAKAVLATYVGH
jgi:hypothetical protein